jgi:phosphonate dehydrogenase
VRSGAFAGWRPGLYGAGLDGAAVGIVGMGKVGRAIARRLAGFGSVLAYSDPAPLPAGDEGALGLTRRSLEALLANSDAVVVAAPLAAGTLHLIDAAALARMKPGAFLVNVGRGSVVDEAAVADALESDRLAGYAADVFEFEDWARPDRPRAIEPRLLAQPSRTLFTAHQGSAVDAVRRDIAMAAARAVVQALNGEVPDGALNDPRPGAS